MKSLEMLSFGRSEMALSNSRLAFKDCYDLFDQALSDPKGLKVRFNKHSDAWHFRHRMHQARKLDRRDNKTVFAEGHPMYGMSNFDKITIRVEKDEQGFWLRLTKIDAQAFETVSLTEEDNEQQQAVDGDR